MSADSTYPAVAADDFARRFSQRGGNLMWLLGAGASAAAGIPTAWDMIWEFKQQLYISQRRVSPKMVADLANPAVRRELQSFIDGVGNLPPPGAPDEYAALFEAVYPSEADRRTYIASKVSGAKPSYGHIALATMMRGGRARLTWTTNFDPLIADGCAKVYGGTGQLTTVAIETGSIGRQVIDEGRWPVEVKLHGDFRSRRLKNTGDELREQDAKLRALLIESCCRWGLIVAGYSGRDDSIMDTLEAALDRDTPFPAGLFWLHRGEDPPLLRVQRLLAAAARKGVDGGLVPIENFDEVLRDLVRLAEDLDTKALDELASERRIWSPAPRPTGKRGFPVVRLNALEMVETPTVCRRVVCRIGGVAEVRSAIEATDLPVLATRSRAGVLAFGSDADVRAVLSAYDIESFDLHAIEVRRLRYESQERGLLREALTNALTRTHEMIADRRRSSDLLTPSSIDDAKWASLKTLTGSLGGTVPKHPELSWREGVGIRLDWADERLWLLLEPRTVFEGITQGNRTAATDFARERTVRRYNPVLNALLSFWSTLFACPDRDILALGISAGVDAAFRLGDTTAYSGRARP
ncbi:SIR2 family protein [Bradyrhizobium sp. KB893862 SZCCT0404]|uniref:SIR2 family protein n=1 Tax=Bradyrhizobium sp. KB893862 SZCCT0404 TaxID=2807672 RepID=UPI001BAB8DFA|nr:SIR2 family protein [Bradyrhizobium sp. KB893862 SZCCT0404]MBR1172680.1 SIR2 family protein [Bradyrhizobium sp. KB893862 SZCCT0404]